MNMGQISADRDAVQAMEKGSGGCRSMSSMFVSITTSTPRSFTMVLDMVTRKCIIRQICEYLNEQLFPTSPIGRKLFYQLSDRNWFAGRPIQEQGSSIVR